MQTVWIDTSSSSTATVGSEVLVVIDDIFVVDVAEVETESCEGHLLSSTSVQKTWSCTAIATDVDVDVVLVVVVVVVVVTTRGDGACMG